MKSFKKIIFSLFIPLALVLMALGLSCNAFAGQDAVVDARGPIYVGSGATCTITGGTVNGDIDVDGGSLYLTGGTVKGNINLNGTFNYKSSCTLDGKVNLLNTSSYVTLSSSLTQTMTVVPSSMNKGTKIAYSATSSYLDVSKFNVEGLPALKRLVVSNGYIQIDDIETYTVTISSTTGGSVDVRSVPNVPKGTKVTVNSNKLTIEGYATITATATTGYSFTGWTNAPSSITSAVTITANFQINTYTVTISAGSGGTVSDSKLYNVPYGSSISTYGSNGLKIGNSYVYAYANDGYEFDHWSKTSGTITGTTTIYAYFNELTYTVSIYAGTGGSVDRSAVYDVPYGASYSTSGSTLTVNGTRIQATADTGYYFDYWDCYSSGTVTDDMTIYAYFEAYTYTIYFHAGTGGSVNKSSTTAKYGTSIRTSSNTLTIGSFSVTATADTGYSFDYWDMSSSTVNGDMDIYARFEEVTYTIYIYAGSGGRVSRSSITASYGTSISSSGNTLTIGSTSVTATANSGYTFDYWSTSSGTVTGSTTIYAYFKASTITVTIRAGSGGSVSQTSIEVAAGTSYSTNYRTLTIGSTKITAEPSSGYLFNSWSSTSGTINSSTTITANFIYARNASLVVGLDTRRTLSPYEKALILLFNDLKNYNGNLNSISDSNFENNYNLVINGGFESTIPGLGIMIAEVSVDDYVSMESNNNNVVDLYFPSALGSAYSTGASNYWPGGSFIPKSSYIPYTNYYPTGDYDALKNISSTATLITGDAENYFVLSYNYTLENAFPIYRDRIGFFYDSSNDFGQVYRALLQNIWGNYNNFSLIPVAVQTDGNGYNGILSSLNGGQLVSYYDHIMIPIDALYSIDPNIHPMLQAYYQQGRCFFISEIGAFNGFLPPGYVNMMQVSSKYINSYLVNYDYRNVLANINTRFGSYAKRLKDLGLLTRATSYSFANFFAEASKLDLLRNIIGY